jgi:AbiV family abortive infection protein
VTAPSTPSPRATRDAIAKNISPERAIYFSKAAYDNASRLVDAALLLHDHGHYGPARSTAISAREEFGKFFAALLYSAGVYDAPQFARLLRQHSAKQLLGTTLALCGGPLKALSDHIAPALQVKTKTLQEAFDLMAANLERVLPHIPIPDEAAIAEVQSRLARAHSGGDDARRTEALYVDLISTGLDLAIRAPTEMVTAADALDEIETARAYVRWASPVMEAMSIGDDLNEQSFNVQEFIDCLRRLATIAQQDPPLNP